MFATVSEPFQIRDLSKNGWAKGQCRPEWKLGPLPSVACDKHCSVGPRGLNCGIGIYYVDHFSVSSVDLCILSISCHSNPFNDQVRYSSLYICIYTYIHIFCFCLNNDFIILITIFKLQWCVYGDGGDLWISPIQKIWKSKRSQLVILGVCRNTCVRRFIGNHIIRYVIYVA